MAKSKLVKANEKIADKVVGGYKKIEETVEEAKARLAEEQKERERARTEQKGRI